MSKISKTKFRKAVNGSEGILTKIASRMGVSRQSLYVWLDKNKDEKKLIHQESEKISDLAESKLFEKIKNGEAWAIKYFLSTKGKKRGYHDKIEEKDNQENKPFWTPEERQEEIKRLLGR